MFSIFKKQQRDKKEKSDKERSFDKGEAKEKDIEKELEKNITVHVMPERFRIFHTQKDKAKITGLFIIIGGGIFLIIASVALYFYLFKSKPSEIMPIPSAQDIEMDKSETRPKVIDKQESKKAEKQDLPAQTGSKETRRATTSPIVIPITEESRATSTATSTQEISGFSLGVDSDNDGLTDKEEEIFGSQIDNKDSDGDGYNDLTEVINLYNPTGAGKLKDNANISQYTNSTYNYNLIYPAGWSISNVGGDDSVMFRSDDNHFIQVIVQSNVNKETIEDWYKSQFDVISIEGSRRIISENWRGIKSEDGLIIYLSDTGNNYIYTITYNLGNNNVLEYKNIFEMIISSFEVSI
jgi:hypothetical protein